MFFYFPSAALDCCDWVREPLSTAPEVDITLTLQEKEKLTELEQDRGLRLRCYDLSLESLWRKISNEFSNLANRATAILLPFPVTYLCETGFFNMTLAKLKNEKDRELLRKSYEFVLCKFIPEFQIYAHQAGSNISQNKCK